MGSLYINTNIFKNKKSEKKGKNGIKSAIS